MSRWSDFSRGLDFDLANTSATRAATPLTTPTYEDSGQAIHPSVVDMGAGNTWNGYRYWMAMTPYAANNADVERCSILASSDGDTWAVPAGVTNPVVNAKHTDPELFYEDGTMYLFYRDGTGGADSGAIFLCSSTNGFVNLTTPVRIIDVPDSQALSPSVLKNGATYELYAVDIETNKYDITRRTASSLTGEWSAPTTVISTTPFDLYPWHIDVIYTESRYVMVVSTSGGACYWMAQSADGVTWEIAPKKLLEGGGGTSVWDNGFYRSTLVRTATGFDMWYSAFNGATPNVWGTGRTAITVLKRLNL